MSCTNCTCADTGGGGEESSAIPAYTFVILLVLLILSGLFSGLNLGLMSLDKIGLEIVMGSGTSDEKRYAKGLLPLRAQGNLLLCTLLLGNTAVNALLAIFMADLAGGLIGSLTTTFGIVIFGEIIPQSVCSRHGLAVGYYTRYIVMFFMILTFVVAYPIAKVLDYVLEEEIGAVYNREQMMKLFEMHAGQKYGDLIADEVLILKGVLQLGKKTVKDIMTPIDKVFMLDINARMDYKNMAKILAKGHSRIPVFDGDRDNIYKLLLVKNMIMLNPGDEVPLRSLLQEGFPEPLYVSSGITLDQMLNEFQNGGSHLAVITEEVTEFKDKATTSDFKARDGDEKVVQVAKVKRNLGIVTLEDVIETMIQEPIKDETEGPDATNIGQKFLKVLRKKNKFKSSTLSSSEGRAISSFLQGMFDPFRLDIIGAHAVEKLVQSSEILQLRPSNGKGLQCVYEAGKPVDFCCLVLDGSLRISVGLQKFRAEAGIWKMLALHALTEEKYVPDFTAVVERECTILKLRRGDYQAALQGKLVEPRKRTKSDGDTSNIGNSEERNALVGTIKKISSPTVTALRRAYGNEVEFEEEFKNSRGKSSADVAASVRRPERIDEEDLKHRSMSAGIALTQTGLKNRRSGKGNGRQ
mmetsp:Transcript_11259/g.27702  ORF Transcript_11259/g.27702 Transcript_11259/m.27702 type:complete len:637 (-) Transcript_11259:620-2530(-)|eukprot:CAMPEP_0114497364 /NCGR_PEP_ID=MMETSP0109-20121206/6287_1 /TAXON_ID=29199 /ORGANISM="Chlorarachnion reptans, Strain CCCM449" /LENGTH=636 /DNA_ID=CAMNT_0001674745 /DNA_START=111 /DNA_END=2021 /DNA_ORIENTATION=-